MRCHERQEAIDFERAAGLQQHATDEFGVHMAEDRHSVLDEGMERAGGELHREGFLLDLRLEPDVVEVLVQRVELVRDVRIRSLGALVQHDAAHEVAVPFGVLDPLRGDRVVGPGRLEEFARPSARAPMLRDPHHEALGFEHTEVIAQRVHMKPGGLRQFGERLPWTLEELVHDAEAARLSETAVGVGATGHRSIIPAREHDLASRI